MIEPAAAAGTAGDRAILVAAGAQVVAHFIVNLGWEWPFADARHISLGHADDRADGRWADAGSGGRAARRSRRGGDKGISSVVDVQHGSLRAFEHHAAALGNDLVQQAAGVGDKGADLFGGGGVLVVDLAPDPAGRRRRAREQWRSSPRRPLRCASSAAPGRSRSTMRRPLRDILSSYAGPMPLLVVPIFWRPGAHSAASSIMRW